ncbi:unnamed protein product [Cunninghamella blakesleeana]
MTLNKTQELNIQEHLEATNPSATTLLNSKTTKTEEIENNSTLLSYYGSQEGVGFNNYSFRRNSNAFTDLNRKPSQITTAPATEITTTNTTNNNSNTINNNTCLSTMATPFSLDNTVQQQQTAFSDFYPDIGPVPIFSDLTKNHFHPSQHHPIHHNEQRSMSFSTGRDEINKNRIDTWSYFNNKSSSTLYTMPEENPDLLPSSPPFSISSSNYFDHQPSSFRNNNNNRFFSQSDINHDNEDEDTSLSAFPRTRSKSSAPAFDIWYPSTTSSAESINRWLYQPTSHHYNNHQQNNQQQNTYPLSSPGSFFNPLLSSSDQDLLGPMRRFSVQPLNDHSHPPMKDSTSDSLLGFSRRHSVAGPTLKQKEQSLQQNNDNQIQSNNNTNDQGILLSSLKDSIDEMIQTGTINKSSPSSSGVVMEIVSSSSNTTSSTVATNSSSPSPSLSTAATAIISSTKTVTSKEKSSLSPKSKSSSSTTTALNTKKDLYAKVAASAIITSTTSTTSTDISQHHSSHYHTSNALPLQQSVSTPTITGSNYILPKGDDMGKGIKLELIPKEARFFVVEFKASRIDLFFSSHTLKKNDLVMVEADRGHDLGKIIIDNMNSLQLMKYIQQKQPSAIIDASSSSSLLSAITSSSTYPLEKKDDLLDININIKEKKEEGEDDHINYKTGSDNKNKSDRPEQKKQLEQFLQQQREMRIKRLFRLARQEEINSLRSKDQDENKALATCQQKVQQRKLNINVVNAEYQWDRHKLTFYFVADRRVDFRELVRELFKLYKTRIWMCDVNAGEKQS